MINILKKIFLILFLVILLAQIPFIYRRYQFGLLKQKISSLQNERAVPTENDYRDYKGIIHAHSSLGGHSTGQFDELVTAAKSNGLDFVIMTEHPSENFDTSASTLKGIQQGVLFVGGNEISTADDDRFLLIPGSEKAFADGFVHTPDFLQAERSQGKLAFITYPYRFHSWDTDYDVRLRAGDRSGGLFSEARPGIEKIRRVSAAKKAFAFCRKRRPFQHRCRARYEYRRSAYRP